MILDDIVQQIRSRQRFLIASHQSPDGDAIGSTLGLALALRRMGKDVVACNVDGVPDVLSFLKGSELVRTTVSTDDRFDVGFLLDAGELDRAGFPVAEKCDILINVDHHPHSTFGDLCYVDTSVSATAILVYRILSACGYQPDLDVAKALYVGVLSDTGSFRYSSANQDAFHVAGTLVALGVDPWEIASNLYESYPLQRMRLLGLVLSTLDVSACGRYASVALMDEFLKETGALVEQSDGFVNYPRAIKGVEVALFIKQQSPTLYQISFRSRGTIDVGSLARSLGGGGHHNAAGARIEAASFEEARKTAYRHLDELLN